MQQPKRILRNLKLRAIAAVDEPCQEGAKMAILKRREDAPVAPDPSLTATAVAKYITETDGAHSFDEVLRENKFSAEIWPMTDALSQSIRSIVGDKSIASADRETRITQTVDEFLAAVRSIEPTIEKQLLKLISKRTDDMNEVEKLQKRVDELTGQLASANALAASEKARADKAEQMMHEEEEEHKKTKGLLVTATDETIKVGDQEIRKSVVGDASFSMAKALRDERDMARFEKSAETEFKHVAGTTSEKALVLRAREKMDEDTRKALDAVLTSAEKLAAGAFSTIGHGGGVTTTPTQKAAIDQFEEKVQEYQKAGMSGTAAMAKARTDHPELFADAYGSGAGAASN